MSVVSKNSRIFVAGHTGLLGSSLVKELKSSGYKNLILQNRKELDLTDSYAVHDFMHYERPDCVILCAAKVGGIQANIKDPVGFLTENLRINTNVIQSALEAEVSDLVYIGSSCMYPRNYKSTLKEEYLLAAPLEPTNEGYALAKIAGAKLCEYCNSQFGANYKTLIPCNLYGPADKFMPASSHLIAAIIDKVYRAKTEGLPDVEIWGDGSARREFLYVNDLASFICRSLESLDDFPQYLNVGFGMDYSVLEYYQTVTDVLGFNGDFVFDTSRPVGMSSKLLDSSLAACYGWRPETPLRDGIEKTYSYYLEQLSHELSAC